MITTAALKTISLVSTVVGTAVSAYGSIQAAEAEKDAANYNAAVARNNAIAAKQSADFEIERLRERKRRLRGSQIARISKSGTDLSDSYDLLYDSELQQELDIMATAYQGNVVSNAELASGVLARKRGSAASTAGLLGAGETLLGGTERLANSFID